MTISRQLGQITGGHIKASGGGNPQDYTPTGGYGGVKKRFEPSERDLAGEAPEGYVNPQSTNPDSKRFYEANPLETPSQDFTDKLKAEARGAKIKPEGAGMLDRINPANWGYESNATKSDRLDEALAKARAYKSMAIDPRSHNTTADFEAAEKTKRPAHLPQRVPGLVAPDQTAAASPSDVPGLIQRVKAKGYGAGGPIRNLIGARRENVDSGYIQQQRDARQAKRQGRRDDRRDKRSASQMLGQLTGQGAKQAGFYSEWGSGFNPLNSIGGPVGTILAGLTPTRDLGEQAETDESMWKNLLIPGVGPYNAMKRLGTSIRGPEARSERRDLAEHRDEERKALRDRRLQPRDGDGDGKVNDGTTEEKEARAGRAADVGEKLRKALA